MPTIYCRSTDGNDVDDGSSWALAKATLQAAMTAAGAGGRVYVSQAHAEVNSAAGFTAFGGVGTLAAPLEVLCVDDTTGVLTTGASVTQTFAASFTFNSAFVYYYGVKFILAPASGASLALAFTSTNPWWMRFEKCEFHNMTNHSAARITMGSSTNSTDDMLMEWIDCKVKGFLTTTYINVGCPFVWRDTSDSVLAAGSAVITPLAFLTSASNPIITFRGLNLTAFGASKFLFSSLNLTADVLVSNCQLNASLGGINAVTMPGPGAGEIRLSNCDSGSANHKNYKLAYAGTVENTAAVYRTGGATDGTTPISIKMVTVSGVKYHFPLESEQMVFWNDTVGSPITVTIPVAHNLGAALTDAEMWIEVDYLGTSGSTRSSRASDRKTDVLASAVAQPTDSGSSWVGLTTPTKQTLAVTFTPQIKGLVRVWVCLAKGASTVYFDPMALSTATKTYASDFAQINVATTASGGGETSHAFQL